MPSDDTRLDQGRAVRTAEPGLWPSPAWSWAWLRRLAGWLLALLFLLVVLAPFAAVLNGSVTEAIPGSDTTRFGFEGWARVLGDDRVLAAIGNTLWLAAAAQVIALPLGILLSWLLGRTDLPGRGWLEFAFWVSFFLPVLAVLQGWILLLDPHYGLVNQGLKRLFGVVPFDLYSSWGIVFAHLATTTVSAKVMMLTPAFQNMDSRYEEAARMAGDGRLATLVKISAPLVLPAIAVTAVMGIIRALESFEIELVLGAPRRIEVYSTLIYSYIRQDPIDTTAASALGVLVILAMGLLALTSRRLGRRDHHATLSGHSRAAVLTLGRWRWPAFALVAGIALLLTVLPIGFLAASSVMTMFGFFNLDRVWTWGHWASVLGDPVFAQSLRNTLVLCLASSVLAVGLSAAVAYAILRSRRVGALLDLASWVPFTMPGVLYSLAMLWLILNSGAAALYGTTLSLVLTVALAGTTLGVQLIKANLKQISREMEEAAWIAGAPRWRAMLQIVVPLSVRSIAVVAVMSFVAAARNIGHLSLLVSSDNRPLSILQLEYVVEGRHEAAAVVGVVVVAIAVAAAALARRLGYQLGAGARS